MMNNTAKVPIVVPKVSFFPTFGTTIGTFHIFHFDMFSLALRSTFDIPSLILRYAFASLTEADRVHYGGRSSSLRRMNEELTRAEQRNRVTSYIEEMCHFQVYYFNNK